MTIFAVLLPDAPMPGVRKAIETVFPDDHLQVGTNQFLVSFPGTAAELTARLGIYDAKDPQTSTGNAIVLATTSYFGRGPTNVWDWMKNKLERASG